MRLAIVVAVLALTAPVVATAASQSPLAHVVADSKCGRRAPAGGKWRCVANRVQVREHGQELTRIQFSFQKIEIGSVTGRKTATDDWIAP